jgi:transcription-repair coupling factor (superfamily II helicase)
VEDEGQRMDFHRRLAETATLKDVTRLKGELADRYGKLPKAAVRLVKLAELRVLCAQAGIRRIDVRKGRAVFYRVNENGPSFVENLSAPTPEKRLAALAKRILQIGATAKEGDMV